MPEAKDHPPFKQPRPPHPPIWLWFPPGAPPPPPPPPGVSRPAVDFERTQCVGRMGEEENQNGGGRG